MERILIGSTHRLETALWNICWMCLGFSSTRSREIDESCNILKSDHKMIFETVHQHSIVMNISIGYERSKI